MIEAEVKARVRDPDDLHARLRARGAAEPSLYRDTYYDTPDGSLDRDGRELRLRVREEAGRVRCLVTYKGSVADASTGSKPEVEMEVGDAGAADEIFGALGFRHVVAFEKHCVNYAFRSAGRDILATVVTVPELNGTFVEVETLAADADVTAALAVVRAVAAELGIGDADLTTELYTDAVRRQRGEL